MVYMKTGWTVKLLYCGDIVVGVVHKVHHTVTVTFNTIIYISPSVRNDIFRHDYK